MRKTRSFSSERVIGILVLAIMTMALAISVSAWAYGADENGALLAGTVKSDSGEKMSGVTVSAKAEGRTITTTVFTDGQGDYYFPPMAPGEYEVWAQADTFETARAKVNLTAARHQDFALKPLKEFQRQLTGDQLLASLPDGTPDDRRLDLHPRSHEARECRRWVFGGQERACSRHRLPREGIGRLSRADQRA